ncbi:hypothetical protein HU200_062386 [Digitaria exilis]|uniref:Uncharacterized protein n=1 Tax=Digitaria exilis TaxID=1010633 RepID=A0A835A2X2_9POAL|nr:hypothetical protein HU200_062386 [Digitaria exilis]
MYPFHGSRLLASFPPSTNFVGTRNLSSVRGLRMLRFFYRRALARASRIEASTGRLEPTAALCLLAAATLLVAVVGKYSPIKGELGGWMVSEYLKQGHIDGLVYLQVLSGEQYHNYKLIEMNYILVLDTHVLDRAILAHYGDEQHRRGWWVKSSRSDKRRFWRSRDTNRSGFRTTRPEPRNRSTTSPQIIDLKVRVVVDPLHAPLMGSTKIHGPKAKYRFWTPPSSDDSLVMDLHDAWPTLGCFPRLQASLHASPCLLLGS